MIMGGQGQDVNTVGYNCLFLSKKHYISPFIELKDKTIKVFKSTKNGFEKSLGATKHKFDWIGYDQESLMEKIVSSIKLSF